MASAHDKTPPKKWGPRSTRCSLRMSDPSCLLKNRPTLTLYTINTWYFGRLVKYATQYAQYVYAQYAICAKRFILSAVNLQKVKQRMLTVPTRFLL